MYRKRKRVIQKNMLDYYTFDQLSQMQGKYGNTLAHELAKSGEWFTYSRKVLMLKNANDDTVCEYLIAHNKTWQTFDVQLLLERSVVIQHVTYFVIHFKPIRQVVFYNSKLLTPNSLLFEHYRERKVIFATRTKKNIVVIIPII